MTDAVNPTPEQLAQLAELPQDHPVLMVNLLRFVPGGEESYAIYARDVMPFLEGVGGRVLYSGRAEAQVIGDGLKPWWHAILVVEYPKPPAFLAMVADPEYQLVHRHRHDALERGELIATSAWLPGG